MAFQTKIINPKRFAPTRWTADVMVALGQALADHIRERIQGAVNVWDQPAKPLSEKYREQKEKRGGLPIRNWTEAPSSPFSGWLMRSLKVLEARPMQAVIGFLAQAGVMNAKGQVRRPPTRQLVRILQKHDREFGASPSDRAFIAQRIAQQARMRVVGETKSA